MRIYIAGPYTKGDVAVNVRNAILAGDRVLRKDHVPYIPHLTHFWHMLCPQSWITWMAVDKEFLQVCNAVWRLPGKSDGADIEVAMAESLGLPVYYDFDEIP